MPQIKIIKPKVEIVQEDNIWKQIEKCARVCYKSEYKISEGSDITFIKNVCKRGHTSVLEHGTVYLIIEDPSQILGPATPLHNIFYSKYTEKNYVNNKRYITTNFRVIFEAFGNFDSAYMFVQNNAVERTEYHIPRYSLRFTCDRGVSHEIVRHRVMSFSQESTRYVNYDKQGFLFIKPAWWEEKLSSEPIEGQYPLEHTLFLNACHSAATTYEKLIHLGQSPQQARAILPNSIKTEIIVTASQPQWNAFFGLRDSTAAHPDMQVVAKLAKAELEHFNSETIEV